MLALLEITNKGKKEVTHTEYGKKPKVSKGNPKETETRDKAQRKEQNKNDRDGGSKGNGKSDDRSNE